MSAPTGPRCLGRRWLFSVGAFRVPSYPFMMYVGCVAGFPVGAALAEAVGLPADRFLLAGILLLAAGLVGARLWYVLQFAEHYRGDPRRIWRRSDGGLVFYGGLLLSLAVSLLVLPLFDLPFWRFWDAGSVTAVIGLAFTKIGCLLNGCCAGRETSGALGLRLPNSRGEWRRRIPTQILESAWAFVTVACALWLRPVLPEEGGLFVFALGSCATSRLVLDPTREPAAPRWARRTNLLVSGALLLAVLLLWRLPG